MEWWERFPARGGAPGGRFLRHALAVAAQRGYRVANADVTVIAERPRLAPHSAAIVARLAELLDLPLDTVSLKAKTAWIRGTTGFLQEADHAKHSTVQRKSSMLQAYVAVRLLFRSRK